MTTKNDLISARGHMRIATDYLSKAISQLTKQEKKHEFTANETPHSQAAAEATERQQALFCTGPRIQDVQHQDVD